MNEMFIERVWLPASPDTVKTSKQGSKPVFYFAFRYGQVSFPCVTVWIDKTGLYYFFPPGCYSFGGMLRYPVKLGVGLLNEIYAQVAEKNPLGLSAIEFLTKFKPVCTSKRKPKEVLSRREVAF